MSQKEYQTVYVAAWIPTDRPQQNVDGDEAPHFVVCSRPEFRDIEAARWILDGIAADKEVAKLMPDEAFAKLIEAAEAGDWETVIQTYNRDSRDRWYIYRPDIGIDDGDPQDIDLTEAVASAGA